MSERCVLFVDGEVKEKSLRGLNSKDFTIIASDGACLKAHQFGWQPEIVIGDLDTIERLDLDQKSPTWRNTQFIQDKSQDTSDLEKALEFCVRSNFSNLIVVGVMGGRLDHSIANLMVLAEFQDAINIELRDEFGVGKFIDQTCRLSGRKGEHVSIVPLPSLDLRNSSGLKFPLKRGELRIEKDVSLSNEFESDEVFLEVSSGRALIYRYSPSR